MVLEGKAAITVVNTGRMFEAETICTVNKHHMNKGIKALCLGYNDILQWDAYHQLLLQICRKSKIKNNKLRLLPGLLTFLAICWKNTT